MAFVGMRYVVASPVATEVAGSDLTYGTGFVVGKAISANVTKNRNTNPLYADDAIAEDDNGITGMSVEINVDDLTEAVRADLLGLSVTTSGTPAAVDYYEETDAAAPYVGFGYMRVRRKSGTTTYQGVWYHKVQFGDTSESAQTRGENIEWQTPTLTGTVFGVSNESSGKKHFRRIKEFSTEALAKTWLDGLAGIT